MREEGDRAPVVVLDLAWNGPGVLRALKAEKKFAKKGLCVDMVQVQCAVVDRETSAMLLVALCLC